MSSLAPPPRAAKRAGHKLERRPGWEQLKFNVMLCAYGESLRSSRTAPGCC
jgi:hypothetical protein